MKLELKHLSPYPPTLQIMWENVQCNFEGIDYGYNNSIILERVNVMLEDVKPILKPLSSLTEDNADFLSGDGYLLICEGGVDTFTILNSFSYNDVNKLLSKHYDVFGLIEKGLAIDANTLK